MDEIPPDIYAREAKQFAAAVSRARAWVGSDASKATDLADSLVALTAHRLVGHQFAEAVAEAQESLALSAKLMASFGPPGPYTPPDAAARVVVAAMQLAALQAEAGHTERAAQTLASADAVRETMTAHSVRCDVPSEAQAWADIAASRIALASGDSVTANARIDQVPHGREFQELDRLQTLAASRWAAGAVAESVAVAWRALELYEATWLPIIGHKGIAAARMERLVAPMTELHADVADRIAAVGEPAQAIVVRRRLTERLEALADRRGKAASGELATARRALAEELSRSGRDVEADELFALPGVRQAPPRRVLEMPEQTIGWGESSDEFAEAARRAAVACEDAVRHERERRMRAEQRAADEATRRCADVEQARAKTGSEARTKADERAAVAESQRLRAERIATHERAQREREGELRAFAEQTSDPLRAARARLEAARTAGDRQAAYAAAGDAVAELRACFTADANAAQALIEALQELATAQRQAGDWWGSRKPAKEARDLAKRWAR